MKCVYQHYIVPLLGKVGIHHRVVGVFNHNLLLPKHSRSFILYSDLNCLGNKGTKGQSDYNYMHTSILAVVDKFKVVYNIGVGNI